MAGVPEPGSETGGARSLELVTDRRRQHELLRGWSTWALTQVLLAPETVADARDRGWAGTHHRDVERDLLIAWSQIQEIAESIPSQLRRIWSPSGSAGASTSGPTRGSWRARPRSAAAQSWPVNR